jgi:hypothetical protein
MSRTNRVDVYVSDSDLSRLEREADEADMSLSGYCMSLIERQWEAEDVEAAADRMDAEEKVEQIVADARDELTSIARDVEQRNEDVADMTARAGSYSIANFELLKDEFDPAESRKAETLLTGSRRLREPLDEHPDRDLDVDPDEADGSSDASEESTDAGNLIQELRDKRDSEEKKRERIERDHAYARRELRKRKRREEERNSGLSGLFDR